MCVCVSLTSDSSETIEVIIIKLGMVTTSDMLMHDVLVIMHAILYAYARFDDLDLDAMSKWVGKGKKSALHALSN